MRVLLRFSRLLGEGVSYSTTHNNEIRRQYEKEYRAVFSG